jgi:hypothetical protein
MRMKYAARKREREIERKCMYLLEYEGEEWARSTLEESREALLSTA